MPEAASAAKAADRVLIGVFQGEQRTGGYAVRIDSIERDGDRLVLRATFAAPPRDGAVTGVPTSPAHVVMVARTDLAGARRHQLARPQRGLNRWGRT